MPLKRQTGPTRERPALAEERHQVIVFHVVSSAEPSPQSAIILTGVKVRRRPLLLC